MRINQEDSRCRYVPAPGTRTRSPSPFGRLLSKLGIDLPAGLPLEAMIVRGWVTPMLRVKLPRSAFDAWKNYAVISPIDADGCPEEDVWALRLYIDAMSGPCSNRRDNWWVCGLDDDTDELTLAARANGIDPASRDALPPTFLHPRSDQEIRPWIDYFAYWQAFQIAEYLRCMTATYLVTDEVPSDPDRVRAFRAEYIAAKHQMLSKKWNERSGAFEWLSRMRTVLGAGVMPYRSDDERRAALRSVVQDLGLTADQMNRDVRDVLLNMWQEWSTASKSWNGTREPLLHLLRQEIEYGVFFIEQISGQKVDFLSDFWSPPGRHSGVVRLIDALPYEDELARRDFPKHADMYLREARAALPALSSLDQAGLRSLVDEHWDRSRSLRRFVLAFHRLHEQLHGEHLISDQKVIRQTERIEQFNLAVMHSERVLSHELRDRRPGERYMDVRKLVRESLNHLLGKWGLGGNGFLATAQTAMRPLFERAQLHELDEEKGLCLVAVDEVGSGDNATDYLISAFVNLVIARNYAAHHDALDFDLVYPGTEEGKPHTGNIAVQSILVALFSTLLAR